MISATGTASDNKKQVLEHLRNKRNERANPPHQLPAAYTSSHAPQPLKNYRPPPPQSRDATVLSHFSSMTPDEGIVLVPNSSPIQPERDASFSHGQYNAQLSHNVASTSNSLFSNNSIQSSLFSNFDPLSAPSGLSLQNGSNASLRRQYADYDPFSHDEGPPRKRLNRGPSESASMVPQEPPSPDIQRVGQRRIVRTIGAEMASPLSDDSHHSCHEHNSEPASPTKPRLARRPSPLPDSLTSLETPSDILFTRFKLSHPTESPSRVRAAWDRSLGDQKKATSLLADPSWSPTVATPKPENSTRIKELDEATRAERAALKEKGKKSMIYTIRGPQEPKPPSTPPSKVVVDLVSPITATPASPYTPLVKPSQRKRIKRLVVSDDEDDEEMDESEDDLKIGSGRSENSYEMRALEYLNASSSEALQELTGCTPAQAELIIGLRPFTSGDDIRSKLGQGKKKAGPSGISPRMFEDCTEMFKGYTSVDNVLEDCERIGASLRATIASWKATGDEEDQGSVSLLSLASLKTEPPKNYLMTQPKLLSNSVTLKEYQLLGVNWLNLLYRSRLSCILADEMGLGKTIQVISFFAHLKEIGRKGPHLVIVPSSTLENWVREFNRFASDISVQTYYADKNERPMLRQTLTDTQRRNHRDGWEVLITTYNLAQGDDKDRKFFRRIDWDCCVYDEGHVLKNFQSQRYQSLLKFGSNWRVLLTGTPLQNNLQELVSLLNFILPEQFGDSLEHLRAIFKVKGDAKVSLLSQERISRAKKMMTPFVLRRKKDQVLKELPSKSERIEWCEMTDLQRSIYRETLQRSRKVVIEATTDPSDNVKAPKKTRANTKAKDKRQYVENSTNVLMDLRKAASHPMLFRRRFTDEALTGITKQLLKEPDFKKRGALFDLVKEDMSVMTDSELQVFCASYKSLKRYLQDQACYIDAGKVNVLLELLRKYMKEDRKVLIFSQFTQILDILQVVLKDQHYKFLILTGSTPVDVRQSLVDEFTEDDTIPVFLLSTKAGGMGINLTAASVVIMFDQDFNPHNDRQAQDRAYRIGQKRDVEVVKLISRGTIEEDMLRLGETKIALDEAVAGDDDEKGEGAPDREMKTSLMNVLRKQLEQEEADEETPDKT